MRGWRLTLRPRSTRAAGLPLAELRGAQNELLRPPRPAPVSDGGCAGPALPTHLWAASLPPPRYAQPAQRTAAVGGRGQSANWLLL